jgi:hypothetical protein
MMRSLAILFLAAATAGAQSPAPVSPAPGIQGRATLPPATPGTTPSAQSGAHPEAVGATETVITIHGFCPNTPGKSGDSCNTVLTKEQFEKILGAVNQSGAPMPPAAVRNLAERYVQILAFADAGEKLGLDKDPKFQELMRVVRLNSLAEAYRRSVEEKYRSPSDAEIENYYKQNIARFEQVKLSRVFVPRVNPKTPREGLDDFVQRAQQTANSLRDRAAKGEEQDIFALKSGEVTKVEPEPAGFQFYKLQGRETLALAQVKNEIIAALHKEHLDAANKSVFDPIHTDLNDTYFGPKSAAMPLTIPPQAHPTPPVTPPSTSPGAGAFRPAPQGSAPPK